MAQPLNGPGCLATTSSTGITLNYVYQTANGSFSGAPLFLASGSKTLLNNPNYPCWNFTQTGVCYIKNTANGNAPKNKIQGILGTYSGSNGTHCIDLDNNIFLLLSSIIILAGTHLRRFNFQNKFPQI
ncbi:MAG: hypothetical protein EOO99_01850 [Pedobacter sp.]|nr:MAG: hypothetical protein EOO99_01850 [Pedobacter sp.]